MRTLRPVLAVVALLTATAVRPDVVWQSDPAAALALARKENKMLLVHVRSAACEPCNQKGDTAFAKLANDTVFVGALDAFVPLRVTGPQTAPLEIDSAKLRRDGVVAVYDATGNRLTLHDDGLASEKIVEALLRVRTVRSLVSSSVGLREGGNVASADFALGHALMAIHEWKSAIERFDRAAKAYAAKGDRQSQQLALVGWGTSTFATGMRFEGRKQVEEVLREAASNTVAAEAHLRLGSMQEVDSHSTVALPVHGRRTPLRAGPRDRDMPANAYKGRELLNQQRLQSAIDSYRKAYELAVVNSSTFLSARDALVRLDPRPLPARGARGASLRIIPPARQGITGAAEFRVEAAPNVQRVEFFLDEKPAGAVKRPPFVRKIDVGATARARVLKARGFDAQNNAVGEATLTINDRVDAFAVSIVAPVVASVSGAQTAEIDVRIPPERRLRSVELSWNGETFATLKAPPLRARFTAGGGLGYLRALAVLDDGTTAEATRVYNAVVGDSVEVGAVTLLVSVLDKNDEPVRGLRAQDFLVHDEKQQVDVLLRSSEEEPVTIGIAVDSSGSMSGKQLYVIRAAAEFLARALRPQDEAFVVSFDDAAWLAHPRSRDAEKLRASVLELTPGGGTSIYDGLTFALQQFQGLDGKKALLVFSDGREGRSSASAADAARLAGVVGVPIYLIVPPGGERSDHALREISESTGGVMMHAVPLEEFGAISVGLAEEVRSQYVLSFTRPRGVQSGAWRTVRVRVRGRDDATVRTMQGYRAN